MFISLERRKSSVAGTGIQYIPGHVEKFVDLVADVYVRAGAKVLELGGGGLRFAVPVALKGMDITVVDLDRESLDTGMVVERVNSNGTLRLDAAVLSRRIKAVERGALEFLGDCGPDYDLIAAFRLVHFFSPPEVERFFELAAGALRRNGVLAFSSMTLHDLPLRSEFNEIHRNSAPVDPRDECFREFRRDAAAGKVREEQNLKERVHCLDARRVRRLADRFWFEVLLSGFPATRIVEGHVLKARGRGGPGGP